MIAMYFSPVMPMSSTLSYPTSRGRHSVQGFFDLSLQSLSTDPIGILTLTLTNVIVGSSIEIQDQALTTSFVNRTAVGTTEVFTLAVYANGSSLNTLKIKVRKGSAAPYYQPWETLVTAVVGAQSIYVAQISD
jgi:hypothetical protein